MIILIVFLLFLICCSSEFKIEHEFKNNTNLIKPRFFPFYTIGRFPNDVCTGSNKMMGTCVVRGECKSDKGIATGSCSTLTSQAVCCVYQYTCGATSSYNNTYFYNNGFPGTFTGGKRCTINIHPCNENICQLRIEFLSFSLAPPNGNGVCTHDFISILGGSTMIPKICGENSGQHVYVEFVSNTPIIITIETTESYTFNRIWQLQIMQIACNSANRAPSGCLQYYFDESGTIMSFNYGTSANPAPNSIGVEGSRQLINQHYGICIRVGSNKCSIVWKQTQPGGYSFTVTGDVGAIDPTLLGTIEVQSQQCTTDFIIIPNPLQNGTHLASDRFCGLGLGDTVSFTQPFVFYVVTNDNEKEDIGNRGFSLSYTQNICPVNGL